MVFKKQLKVLNIGIIAVQGAFIEHENFFKKLSETSEGVKINCIQIRKSVQLTADIDGLIIPGGESTTLARFLEFDKFEEFYNRWLTERKQADKKYMVWGICAGLIFLSDKVKGEKELGQWKLGGVNIECERNGNGRQRESSEKILRLKTELCDSQHSDFNGIFIRSPRITKLLSEDVDVLAYDVNDEPVAVQQNNVIVTCFHPELSDDFRWHKYFIQLL